MNPWITWTGGWLLAACGALQDAPLTVAAGLSIVAAMAVLS